jgi:hypothetical protein
MTSNRWDAWEPQEPPGDFAARAVAAALADRAERRRAFVLGRRRATLVGAVAAVMFAGVAWGFGARQSRTALIERPSERAVIATASVGPVEAPPLVSTRVEPSAAVSPPAPLRRRTETPAPLTTTPDAGRKVIVPPCQCVPHQEICTCF